LVHLILKIQTGTAQAFLHKPIFIGHCGNNLAGGAYPLCDKRLLYKTGRSTRKCGCVLKNGADNLQAYG